MERRVRYRFGRSLVEIKATHPAGELLQKEYEPLKDDGTGRPDLTLDVGDHSGFEIPPGAFRAENVFSDGKRFRVDTGSRGRFGDAEFKYGWDGHPYLEKILRVSAHCDERYVSSFSTRLVSALRKFRDWNYIHPLERVAKNLIYNLMEPVLQLRMLQDGQTFLHSAAVHDGDGAVVFTGWGGAGKTATSLRLIIDHGMKFLTDDLLMVDSDARAYLYPKRMQIYAYNVAGFDELYERLMKGRGPLDRINWHVLGKLKGPKGVRRRVSAGQAYLFWAWYPTWTSPYRILRRG